MRANFFAVLCFIAIPAVAVMVPYGQHVLACALVAPSAISAIMDAKPAFVNLLSEDMSLSFQNLHYTGGSRHAAKRFSSLTESGGANDTVRCELGRDP